MKIILLIAKIICAFIPLIWLTLFTIYAKKGWCEKWLGTVQGYKKFFAQIIHDWNALCEDYCTGELADVTYFWIE